MKVLFWSSVHDNFFIEEHPSARIAKMEFGEIIAEVILGPKGRYVIAQVGASAEAWDGQ